ncbi:holocarboxylase synthetase-like protein isoform X2 [Rhynchophorus ferrugineus]|uniref:holocarboxylase synthetase-like protein isoform X2 n=1 Tax=Rhynchophorus ferrugineus TaxID=354439 RepID=UPI003FCDD791
MQKINLSSQWVVFPRDHKYFPIHFEQCVVIDKPNIYVHLQAVLDSYTQHQAEILEMERFGEFIAWKATEHFEAILKTDMDKLSRLVHCFSQSDCDINHELQLLRIETVDIEGKPKRIKYDRKFSKDSTLKYSLAPIHWKKFVADIKDLYSKVRDATNPKITIDNGTPKPEDLKIVPVSEVKPIKKEKKYSENKDKHTLEVSSSDYRRHKSSDHTKKEKEKSIDRHKVEKDKSNKKEEKGKEEKEHKSKDYRKARYEDEFDSSKYHKRSKDIKNGLELEPKKKPKTFDLPKDIEFKELKDKSVSKHQKRKDKEQIKNEEKRHGSKLEQEDQPSTSIVKQSEKLTQEKRTSSKEKKLVRSSATCDEPNENVENVQFEQNENSNTILNNGTEDGNQNIDSSPSESVTFKKNMLKKFKPPNVLVYADSIVAKGNVKEALHTILNRDRYTIYDLPITDGISWNETTALVVVCGSVEPQMTSNLIKYLLMGGQLLCLCSDLLYSVLYTFTTAEVREHELVRFSYGQWKNVKMMHHIFCYQASPAKKQFSKDSDTSNHSNENGSSPITPKTPSTVNIQHNGKDYTLQVQILGTEETWQTPSLLLATVQGSEGRAVFSQVHLEINPNEFVDDENKFTALKDSNEARIDILRDILCKQLELDCHNEYEVPKYTPGYFLGRHDLKNAMLNETHCIKDNKMKANEMTIVFCGKDDQYEEPTNNYLPILIHSCPQNFNTVSYFETLNTKYIGRLVLHSDVMSTTHTILSHNQLSHGIAVICRQQVSGVGRSSNLWISPLGSAPFSLQLHIPAISNLGRTLPILQHIQMTAIIKAIQILTDNNENINIGIKWPNDLYADGCIKLGGIMVTTITLGDFIIANIGSGINLNNSNPTTCINDLIKEVNEKTNSNIPLITHEKYYAQVFNETEKFIDRYQMGDIDYFFDFYYECWLHNDSTVVVTSIDNKKQVTKVIGLDDYGFLKVKNKEGKIITVQPNGNSFDMMKGLIYPKKF